MDDLAEFINKHQWWGFIHNPRCSCGWIADRTDIPRTEQYAIHLSAVIKAEFVVHW